MRCLVEEVGDAAVARDRDIESLVAGPLAACGQLHAAGLDVVEVRDDDPGFGYRGFAVRQLSHHGLARVLLVLGGGTSEEGHADLVAQHCDGHA